MVMIRKSFKYFGAEPPVYNDEQKETWTDIIRPYLDKGRKTKDTIEIPLSIFHPEMNESLYLYNAEEHYDNRYGRVEGKILMNEKKETIMFWRKNEQTKKVMKYLYYRLFDYIDDTIQFQRNGGKGVVQTVV